MNLPSTHDPRWPEEPAAVVATEDYGKGPRGLLPWILRKVPALDALHGYTWRDGGKDLVAGITVATVAVPQAMAYAAIANIPPEYGLYTAMVITAVGALFDSSRQLINGPTNAISIALLSALAVVPEGERLAAAVTLALLVGLIQTGITLLRLGDLTRYISHAVIVGFTTGASVLLVMDQLKNLLGLTAFQDSTAPFLKRFWLTMLRGGPIHPWTATLGIGAIALVMVLRQANAALRRRGIRIFVPEFLVVVVAMALIVKIGQFQEKGVAIIGAIPAGLPGFQLPRLHWETTQNLFFGAFAIAMLGLLEALAMAKSIAAQTGQKLDIHQQCLSEGLANLTGSFFHCFPGSGSLTRSAINQQSGAVSQWSGVISAVGVAAIMLLFRPLAEYIPRSALAGLLILTGWRMIDRQQLRYHLRATRFDAGIVLVTALSAVCISVEFCILIGVFLSFVLYVPRAAGAHLAEFTLTPEGIVRERVPTDPPCDRLLLYNLEGELFFGSAQSLEQRLASIEQRAGATTRVIVLRVKRVRNPDSVCLHLIDTFIRRLEKRGLVVLLCGVRRDLAQALAATGIDALVGKEHIFPEAASLMSSTMDAMRYAYKLLGEDICSTCPRHNDKPPPHEADYMI
jgi:SulP family sulfate permease